MFGKRTIAVIMCIGIAGIGLFALTGGHKESVNDLSRSVEEALLDSDIESENARETFKGSITQIENGKDGATYTIETTDGLVYATMSAVSSEILGSPSAFEVGTEVVMNGEAWVMGEEKRLTVASARIKDLAVSEVWNLRGTVTSIVREKELTTIEFTGDDDTKYVTQVTNETEIPVGTIEALLFNSRLWVSGSVTNDGLLRIDADTLLVDPHE